MRWLIWKHLCGPTGSGKSVHGNAAIALEQKYGGFTYIFDIGGSYESVVELYGGRGDSFTFPQVTSPGSGLQFGGGELEQATNPRYRDAQSAQWNLTIEPIKFFGRERL
jgi:hypothetical protein